MLQDLIQGHLRPFALFVKRAGDLAIFALPLVLREILLGDADLARYKDTIHIQDFRNGTYVILNWITFSQPLHRLINRTNQIHDFD